MIEILYHRNYHRLTMQGHAMADDPGKDLVCSAASMLAYTLAANAQLLAERGCIRDLDVKLEPGDCEIRFQPVTRFRHTVTMVTDAVCLGLQLLARDNPEYVSMEIRQ